MGDNIKLSGTGETLETLEAACSALDFALDHAHLLMRTEPKASEVPTSLAQGLEAAITARLSDFSTDSFRGYVANAVAHLRASLKTMQDITSQNPNLYSTARANARALSLLYPLTQTEEPILLVARKKSKSSRRRPPFINRRNDKMPPLFEVEIGKETNTNFFAGFSQDISSGGLFIATYDIHPIGTKLTVKARLPSDRVLAGEAAVHWIREYNEASPDVAPGMGVIFAELDPDESQEINRFMTDREAIFYDAV
ncbi:MAG: TIGR02266 family protein [Proteobacteria bacterium]|nr:TIGR02266 family protein [Pseudomonadota bacterium]